MKYIIGLLLVIGFLRTTFMPHPRPKTYASEESLKVESGLLQDKVKARLKGFDVTDFADLQIYEQGVLLSSLCGRVDAKNRFGDDIGYTRFVAWSKYDTDA